MESSIILCLVILFQEFRFWHMRAELEKLKADGFDDLFKGEQDVRF